MSRPKEFPVYVAVDPSGAGCGHQHERFEAACHCADALARRDPGNREFGVIEVTKDRTRRTDYHTRSEKPR
jgi:hypothetical protein